MIQRYIADFYRKHSFLHLRVTKGEKQGHVTDPSATTLHTQAKNCNENVATCKYVKKRKRKRKSSQLSLTSCVYVCVCVRTCVLMSTYMHALSNTLNINKMPPPDSICHPGSGRVSQLMLAYANQLTRSYNCSVHFHEASKLRRALLVAMLLYDFLLAGLCSELFGSDRVLASFPLRYFLSVVPSFLIPPQAVDAILRRRLRVWGRCVKVNERQLCRSGGGDCCRALATTSDRFRPAPTNHRG